MTVEEPEGQKAGPVMSHEVDPLPVSLVECGLQRYGRIIKINIDCFFHQLLWNFILVYAKAPCYKKLDFLTFYTNRLSSTIYGLVEFVHSQYSYILTSQVSTVLYVRQNN